MDKVESTFIRTNPHGRLLFVVVGVCGVCVFLTCCLTLPIRGTWKRLGIDLFSYRMNNRTNKRLSKAFHIRRGMVHSYIKYMKRSIGSSVSVFFDTIDFSI